MRAPSTVQRHLQEDQHLDSEAQASSSTQEPNQTQIELLSSRPRTSYRDTLHLLQSLHQLEEYRQKVATSLPDLSIISEDAEEMSGYCGVPKSAEMLPDKSKWSRIPCAKLEARNTRDSPKESQRGQSRKMSPCSSMSDSRSTSPIARPSGRSARPNAMPAERSWLDSPRGIQKGNKRCLWDSSSGSDSRSTSPIGQFSGRHHNSSQHQRTQFTEKVPNKQASSPAHAASSSRQSSVGSSVQRREDAKPDFAGGQMYRGMEASPPKLDKTKLKQFPRQSKISREYRMSRATREEEYERAARNMEEEFRRRKASLSPAPERANLASRKGPRPKGSDHEHLRQVVSAEPPTTAGVVRVDRNMFISVPKHLGRMSRATREEECQRTARNTEDEGRLRKSRFASAPQQSRRGSSLKSSDHQYPREGSMESGEILPRRTWRRGVEPQQRSRIASLDDMRAVRRNAPKHDLRVPLPGMVLGEHDRDPRRSGEPRRRSLSKSSASSSSSSESDDESHDDERKSAPELPRGRFARLRNRLGKFFQRREKPKFRSKAEELLAQRKWEEVATDLVLVRAGLLPPGHLA